MGLNCSVSSIREPYPEVSRQLRHAECNDGDSQWYLRKAVIASVPTGFALFLPSFPHSLAVLARSASLGRVLSAVSADLRKWPLLVPPFSNEEGDMHGKSENLPLQVQRDEMHHMMDLCKSVQVKWCAHRAPILAVAGLERKRGFNH